MALKFPKEVLEKIDRLKKEYPNEKSLTLPVLHLAQQEFGYISNEACVLIAETLDMNPIEILNVATFYTMLNKEPVGKYLIQVCSTLSCSLRGSQEIVEYIKKKLNIDIGETTPDGKFTLVKVECLASCGTAPVIQINDKYYENLTIDKVDEILDNLE